MAPDLFFILPFSGQNDRLTLENPLGKGWAVLHFRFSVFNSMVQLPSQEWGFGILFYEHLKYSVL